MFYFQADKDKANFEKLVEALKGSKEGKTVGSFVKDKFPGDFMDGWRAEYSTAKFEKVCY
jgi:nucleosome binding factor SPN SPT16 subunit